MATHNIANSVFYFVGGFLRYIPALGKVRAKVIMFHWNIITLGKCLLLNWNVNKPVPLSLPFSRSPLLLLSLPFFYLTSGHLKVNIWKWKLGILEIENRKWNGMGQHWTAKGLHVMAMGDMGWQTMEDKNKVFWDHSKLNFIKSGISANKTSHCSHSLQGLAVVYNYRVPTCIVWI